MIRLLLAAVGLILVLLAGTAIISGSCSPDKVLKVEYVHESGESGDGTVGPDGYELSVSKAGRYWIKARASGYQTARALVDVELSRSYRVDLTLMPLVRVEVLLTGVEDPSFRWPSDVRVVALSSEPALGTVLRGLRGSVENPYGVGRFRRAKEPVQNAQGLHVGSLSVDSSGPFIAALCVGARVVETVRPPTQAPEVVVFNWAKEVEFAVRATITVILPGSAFGAFASAITESGGFRSRGFPRQQGPFP